MQKKLKIKISIVLCIHSEVSIKMNRDFLLHALLLFIKILSCILVPRLKVVLFKMVVARMLLGCGKGKKGKAVLVN
jgi:hypothetical protein